MASQKDDPYGIGVWQQSNNQPSFDPSSQEGRAHPPPPGFKFEFPRVPIDWPSVGAAPLATIERRGDAAALAQFLPLIALGDLSRSGGPDVAHPALTKTFGVAQLATQYLIYCQGMMEGQVDAMATDLSHLEKISSGLERKLERRDEKLEMMKKENRRMKKLVNTYSRMLRKHNPDLAKRVVHHGDGRVSLVEKGNEYVQGAVGFLDDDTDFYSKPEFKPVEGERGGGGKENEAAPGDLRMTHQQMFGQPADIDVSDNEDQIGDIQLGSEAPKTPVRRAQSEANEASAGPQSPEAIKLRTSIESLYSEEERTKLTAKLSPKQKQNPILTAMMMDPGSETMAYSQDSEHQSHFEDLEGEVHIR